LEISTIENKESTARRKILYGYRLYAYDYDNDKFVVKKGVYASAFPVVIKSDGTVWDKATLYLNDLAKQRKSSKLLKNVGDDLLDFLRFMETHNIDMLHIPIEKELRVTYRYRQDLLNREKLGRNTAAQRVSRIVAFYEYCFDKNLFAKEELKNRLPKKLKDSLFVKRKEKRWRKNNVGYGFQIEYEVSDLSIPRAPSAEQSTDAIQDGRQLHPLSVEEQEIFHKYLKKHASRLFQLICIIALCTGARLQVICTLRVNDIKAMKDGRIVKGVFKALKVGNTTTIDNKQDKPYNVFFPIWLIEELEEYMESEEWKERAAKSYYKNNNNYVFLSKFGNALYTSRLENKDREQNKYPVESHDRGIERSGEAVRK
jgi:integrase